jgi:hypothetical protein
MEHASEMVSCTFLNAYKVLSRICCPLNKGNHFPDSQQNILDEQQSFQIRAWL